MVGTTNTVVGSSFTRNEVNPMNPTGLADVDLVARVMWAEARGEPLLGLLGVAYVILNRVDAHTWYGSTIQEVSLMPYQFQGLQQAVEIANDNVDLVRIRRLAFLALERQVDDPTHGATHFYSGKKPYWADDMVVTAKIGGHTFCREGGSKDE